jgi:two-component system phosphate regulon response regulator PhoB
MVQVTVLVTSEPAGGLEPFQSEEIVVSFRRWSSSDAMPLLDGSTWAFIDWLLPEMPGIEACRRLRCHPLTAHCRITMVLENDDPSDRRRALAAGANDYLKGPLTRAAILDRVIVGVPQQQSERAAQTIACGDLSIDIVAFQARWQGKPIVLMPTELCLLRHFVEHPERVFTRAQLIAALGKQESQIDERTVDVWIGRLRGALRKVGAGEPLRTVRMMGYVLDRA